MQDLILNLAFLYIFYTIFMIIKEINELEDEISFKKSVDFGVEVCIMKIELLF